MKILIINTLYAPYSFGGAERSVQLLAESLVGMGIEVGVCSLCKPKDPAKDEQLNGVSIFRRPLKNIYWPYGGENRQGSLQRAIWHLLDFYNPFSRHAFDDLLDKYKPDLIHCNNVAGFSVSIFYAAKSRRIPILQTLRDYYFIHPDCRSIQTDQKLTKRLFQRLWQKKSKMALHCVDTFIGISGWMLSTYVQKGYVAAPKKHVILNSAANLPDKKVNETSRKFQLTLGFIGRIEEPKGLAWLLNHLEGYPDVNRIRLLVAGKGDPTYVESLKAINKNLDVTFLGFMAPAEFFTNISLLIVPSLWEEPFGRVVVEAASCGVTSIVSDRGALPELIDILGHGYVYSPLDSSFHAVLDEAISHCKNADGSIFNLEPFDSISIASQYKLLYDQLLTKA